MEDIFNHTILCNKCNLETKGTTIYKGAYKLRAKECPNCGKIIYHPIDLEEYKNFNNIKNKQFQVKLRLVGNSYTVSIPREIIEFQEEMHQEINKLISMSLEEPEKLSLFFTRRIRSL
ncbi:MAG: hypothetical protein ABIB47_02835 [Candidatus Woesearchaeota archaeon]